MYFWSTEDATSSDKAAPSSLRIRWEVELHVHSLAQAPGWERSAWSKNGLPPNRLLGELKTSCLLGWFLWQIIISAMLIVRNQCCWLCAVRTWALITKIFLPAPVEHPNSFGPATKAAFCWPQPGVDPLHDLAQHVLQVHEAKQDCELDSVDSWFGVQRC